MAKKLPRSKVAPIALKRIERGFEALDMRKQGLTYREIAAALDCSHSTAYRMVRDAFKLLIEDFKESADELRVLQLEQLDSMMAVAMPLARDGDMRAMDRVLKIMERVSKLLGLDMPSRVDVTSGDEPITSFTLAVFEDDTPGDESDDADD